MSNTEIDHSILTTAQMKVIEKEDSTIQLLLTFSHEVDYELLTSLHNII